MFIYRIYNKTTQKSYVGKCVYDNFFDRYPKNEWWRSTKNQILIDDYNCFGKDSFEAEILIENIQNKQILFQLECYFISKFNSLYPNGYNQVMPNATDLNPNNIKIYILKESPVKKVEIKESFNEPLQLEGEIWKPVFGYTDSYEVSNFGRVKSLARKVTVIQFRHGKEYNLIMNKKEKILKPALGGIKEDYYRICFYKNGETERRYIQRIVAQAFIPNPNNLPQVNHINCNKLDNFVENLEWTDNSGNQLHAFKHGLNKPRRGEDNNKSKLKTEQILKIRELYISGYSQSNLGRMYNVDPTCIALIVKRKTWKHVP